MRRIFLSVMLLGLLLATLSMCFASYSDVETLEGNSITAWIDEEQDTP